MFEFEVGDEVEVYNINSRRNGTVIALLRYPDNDYPIVVVHDSFDGTPGFKTSNDKIYQRFNYSGEVSGSARQVKLRYRTRTVIRNVYPDLKGTFGPEWETEEDASRYTCGRVGFFRAKERDGVLSEIEYVSVI